MIPVGDPGLERIGSHETRSRVLNVKNGSQVQTWLDSLPKAREEDTREGGGYCGWIRWEVMWERQSTSLLGFDT